MKKTFILSTLLTTSILMSSLTSFAANDNSKIPASTCQNAAKQEQYQGPERRMNPPCPKCISGEYQQKMKEMHEARKKEFESRLNLTDEQKQKAKEIRMKGHQQIKPVFDQIKTKKQELFELKKKESLSLIEQAKIRQLEIEIKALKDQAKSIRETNKNEFEKIQYYFNKYANFLPADNSADITEEVTTFSKWKYANIGITKQGVALFASSADINNFTTLPEEFETIYFYTYILNLYKKIYLKKLEKEFSNNQNLKEARKKFIDFTKNLWIQEVTENEVGSNINFKLNKVFELDRLYYEIKTKYDILYKNLNIEKYTKSTIVIAGVLVALLIFNILNYINMIK